MDTLEKQPCPICGKSTCTLSEGEQEIPYFGQVAVFGMSCTDCGFKKSDVEAIEPKEGSKFTYEIESEDDMNVRVVRSSEATVKIPHMISLDPGPASNGYVTNIEGVLNKFKDTLENARDAEDDNTKKKKLKNMIKKLQKVIWGQEKVKLIIEDPTGNSAIISEKAVKAKVKSKK